ncbi:hypothetical protein P3T76_007433 [Phytophthora citrophthora]|uniref:Uncharacterized protein n=1 Tax=Phytophthora citrophthora TaxID=4793 RepID=A0AAD9GN05_9STRA|nr:hypothetical protein P3T76_007433 [Phytophthora citrophthora]
MDQARRLPDLLTTRLRRHLLLAVPRPSDSNPLCSQLPLSSRVTIDCATSPLRTSNPGTSQVIGQYSIVGQIANTLAKRLLIPTGWLFTSRVQAGTAPTPGTEYLNELITGPNVLDLLVRKPWNDFPNPGPLTLDLALHEREGTPLAAVAASYRVLEERHRQAF